MLCSFAESQEQGCVNCFPICCYDDRVHVKLLTWLVWGQPVSTRSMPPVITALAC